ncbi:MAG: YHS domain-containing (seleno)protein [Rhizobiaceae bacterium]
MIRRQFLAFAAGAAALAISAGHAFAAKASVYTGVVDGTGAGGYDVVAYQTQNKAVPGDATITATHDGIAYRFASEDNRAAFSADPEKYLPRYGGYCAWAVSQGYTAHGDPEAWSVVDGALYLNYSKGVRSRWQQDTAGNISKGDANWPRVLE